MRQAVVLHQRGDYGGACSLYQSCLSLGAHAGASILLANAMLSQATAQMSALSMGERVALRAASLPLARSSLDRVEEREAGQRVKLLTRFAYYLLAFAGLMKAEGQVHGEAAQAVLPAVPERAALLQEATETLQKVVALDPTYTLAWRNLSLALTAAARLEEAERAMRAAVDSIVPPAPVPYDLLYKHGKCLKRLGREEAALLRYCDAVEASKGKEEVPLFWLRVALAEGREGAAAPAPVQLSPACLERCRELVVRLGGATGSSSGSGSGSGGAGQLGAPPNSYIRKLFDGYSSHFDHHLVTVLGYKTPESLRVLARATFGEGASWRACADLGCGTGLGGLAFRGLVEGALDGCDLSPGMVAEAEKRTGLYGLLQTAEVVEWLGARAAQGIHYDLILSADVLVYIGPLEPLFDGVVQSLRAAAADAATVAAGAGAPPPCFVFSTEAMLGEGSELAPAATFELTSTGRCKHAASYIRRLASDRGLTVCAHRREQIRENAGKPVLGDLWVLGVQVHSQ